MPPASSEAVSTRDRIGQLQAELRGLREALQDEGIRRAESLSTTTPLLLVTVGHLGLAIDARRAVEVLPRVAIDDLAEPLDGVPGVIRYRGALVPIIDLFHRFHAPSLLPILSQHIVIVREEDPRGLLVDETLNVATMPRSAVSALPQDATLGGVGVAMVQANDRVFTVLDLDAMLVEIRDVP